MNVTPTRPSLIARIRRWLEARNRAKWLRKFHDSIRIPF